MIFPHAFVSFPQNLVYAKNSTALKYFIKPPLDPLLRVHIFNYTNADRFIAGYDDKLMVEDIGPFSYVEKVEKVNVVYNKNHTISYRVSFTANCFHINFVGEKCAKF